MNAIILLLAAVTAQVPRPSFEVATVKPRTNDPAGRGGGAPLPGRLNLGCVPLRDLIHTAFLDYADGLGVNGPQIKGGPGWIDDSFYEINAKAKDNAPFAEMAGPMLQSLLEERFALKAHRETKELPVFLLTVAKSGLKMQRTKEGSCQPGPERCGPRRMRSASPTTIGIGGRGMTVTEIFSGIISNMVGGPIIDKTGLDGRFDFTLEWTPGGINAPADATGPSIFTAVEEQLGLKLTSGKGPVEVVVIDHVERPSGN
jgi:uncharacterized protein (TIGR03435 family)